MSRRHRNILAGGVLLLAAGTVVIVLLMGQAARKRLAYTREITREAVVGIESLFVDDCNGLYPAARNEIPPQLTTPISYLKPELRADPYSTTSEPMKYYNRPEKSNGSFVIIASRGPDGDVDMDRLPYREEIMPAVITIDPWELPGVKTTTASLTAAIHPHWARKLTYRSPDGQTRTNTTITVTVLPETFGQNRPTSREAVFEELSRHGIFPYDPTNGSASDGDVLYMNAH